MHLSFSLNELLKLTDVTSGTEVPGGGPGVKLGNTLEFTSEFFGDQYPPSVEGVGKQFTFPERLVAGESSMLNQVVSPLNQAAKDPLSTGHPAVRLAAEVPQSPVTRTAEVPGHEIGWQSSNPDPTPQNLRALDAVTVENGSEATGPIRRQTDLPSGDSENLRRTKPVHDDLGSKSSEKDSLPDNSNRASPHDNSKRASVHGGVKPELTVAAQSGQGETVDNAALRASIPTVVSEQSAIRRAPIDSRPKLAAPKLAAPVGTVTASAASPEPGTGSEVRPSQVENSGSPPVMPGSTPDLEAVPKDAPKVTLAAKSIRVSERAASVLEQVVRPQTKPDAGKPAERRQNTQFLKELSKAQKAQGAISQNNQCVAEQVPKAHRSDLLAPRFSPTVQVEVERSPGEANPKQQTQSLPNPEKQTIKLTPSKLAPQMEPRSPEASPTLPTAAQPVNFEDGGSIPIPINGTEGAPRVQLSTPSPILPQTMPQHSVPADELSLMLRGLAQQRTGSEVTTTELILEPMELGRIRVTLSGSESSGQITILVERGETLELVKRHLDLVRADLRASGWEATEFSLSRESFSSFDGTDPREAAQRGEADEIQSDSQETAELAEPELARDLTFSGGLDLRV